MRVEGSDDFEGRRQYVYSSIVASNEQVIGSGAYAREVVLRYVERVSMCLEAPKSGRGTSR